LGLGMVFGCIFQPLKDETFRVSKNLTTKYAISKTFLSFVKYRAWETDSLRTYSDIALLYVVNIHVYVVIALHIRMQGMRDGM